MVCAALYRWAPAGYHSLLIDLGVRPFRHPFLDGEFLPRTAACWQQGVDVYVSNPCDALGRVFNYSPLWLRIPFLANLEPWTDELGLLTGIGFLLSLLLLPSPKGPWEAVARTLATISAMTIYAIERANIDLLLFGLALLAALLLAHRNAARPLAYLSILLGGFLKFYPFILLLLSVSERPRRFLIINGLSAVALMLFWWTYGRELLTLAPNIPDGFYFADLFGAKNLPQGLTWLIFPSGAGAPESATQQAVAAALFAVLLVDASWRVAKLSREKGFDASIEALTPLDAALLWVGSTLIFACFMAGQNVDYRGIHLLLVLPGILALARTSDTARLQRLWRWTAVTILFLMWNEDVRIQTDRLLKAIEAPQQVKVVTLGALWLVRELLWWRLIARLATVLIWFVRTSEMARHIPGVVRLQRSESAS
jgi:hypothetical protein